MDYKLLKDKNLVISTNMIKNIDKNLTLNEFLIILYYINGISDSFDSNQISEIFNIPIEDVMTSFDSLVAKELIDFDTVKDKDNKLVDKISIDNLYKKVVSNLNKEEKKEEETTIFDLISKEFDKKLSPIDMEIINGWLELETPIELIKGALKEAAYNGVKTLRYMDQLIYEWTKKDFKTMDDVENYMKTRKKDNDNDDIFDFDWLNDDE